MNSVIWSIYIFHVCLERNIARTSYSSFGSSYYLGCGWSLCGLFKGKSGSTSWTGTWQKSWRQCVGNTRETVYIYQFAFWKDLLSLPTLFFQGQEGGASPCWKHTTCLYFTCGSVLMSSLWVYWESSEWLFTMPWSHRIDWKVRVQILAWAHSIASCRHQLPHSTSWVSPGPSLPPSFWVLTCSCSGTRLTWKWMWLRC